jgi:MobA/MobL family
MAIASGRLVPVPLTPKAGLVKQIAYTTRSSLWDGRLNKSFDFTHLAGDVAYDETIVPENSPARFLDRGVLAAALDDAEFKKIRTPLANRSRLPQVGLSLTVALPPDREVSRREAIEILSRIVTVVRGSHPIPIHTAEFNRHAHVLFATRPIRADGSLGTKVRDFVVTLRPGISNARQTSRKASTSPIFYGKFSKYFLRSLASTL